MKISGATKSRLFNWLSRRLHGEGLVPTNHPTMEVLCTAITSETGIHCPRTKNGRWNFLARYAIGKYADQVPDLKRVAPKPPKTKPKKLKPNTAAERKLSREEFYASEPWRRVRYEALKLHGGRCQCCGRSPPAVVLHVDHIMPRHTNPELELNINNLQVLCEDCNLGKGWQDTTDWRKKVAAE